MTARSAQPESRSFLKLLWPAVAEQFANPPPGVHEEQTHRVKTIRRLPATWRVPLAPPPVTVEASGDRASAAARSRV